MLNNPTLNRKPLLIRRALISVYDKTGIVDFANDLIKLNIQIISTGGTANELRKANIKVIDVSSYTNFPEIMDGRVKTINPLIEGGILGMRDIHIDDAINNNIQWIDLVVCNLYPFEKIISNENSNLSTALENIDIGGPTMIRSAAKNIGWSCPLVDPNDYQSFINELKASGSISFEKRLNFSAKAFSLTAHYESTIQNYLTDDSLGDIYNLSYRKHSDLRYGENPHQKAAAYIEPNNNSNSIIHAISHQGKALSYNNIMDADAALSCLKEFDDPTCIVVKHSNPCGASTSHDINLAFKNAFQSDSLSAFGGTVALNRNCDVNLASDLSSIFFEIIIAPSFDEEALRILSKKKNLRVLEIKNDFTKISQTEIRNIENGLLVQKTDNRNLSIDDLTVVTKIKPNDSDINSMLFGWKVLKHIKSNAILTVKDYITLGVGAGQVSRIDSVEIAIKKTNQGIKNPVLCSDAFFPFRDSIDKISITNIKSIIQPGGSIRDDEIIQACNENDISMVFTGVRCFKH